MVEDEGIAPMPDDRDQLKGVGQSAQILGPRLWRFARGGSSWVLKLLVRREMMTESEVKELFLEAARQQRSVYDQHDVHSMANEQAANILEAITSKLSNQSR